MDTHYLGCKDLWSQMVQSPWLKSGPVLNIDSHYLNVINMTEVFMYFSIRNKRNLYYN